MENIFEKHKKKFLEYIKNEKNIKVAILFGSYANDTYDENSDVDIAVIYKENMDEYEHAGKSIDVSKVFGDTPVDYVDLEKTNIFLQFEIIDKGRIIYCENEEEFMKFSRQVQDKYIEMDYERKKYISYVLREDGEEYGTKQSRRKNS